MTTITDTVTYVDGSPATGQIILSWPPFVTTGGVSIAGGQQEYPIGPGGAISITVFPNIGVQPLGTYYTATYELDRGPVYDEFWLVPATPSITTIGAVRAQFPATPSIMINAQQLTGSGAASGQFLGWSGSSWIPMFPGAFNCAVQSFMGRIGAVTSATGDYTAQQITGPTLADRAVAQSTQIIAGAGLTGGGPLSGDVTLAVTQGTTVQQVILLDDGTLVGAASQLNFQAGTGIIIDINLAPPNGVNIQITNSGGGSGGGGMAIYLVNGAEVGQRPQLNLIAGANTTITGVDDGADTVNITIASTAVSAWTKNPDGSIYYSGGNVGIGVSAPVSNLHVQGTALATTATFGEAAGPGTIDLLASTNSGSGYTYFLSNLYYNGSALAFRNPINEGWALAMSDLTNNGGSVEVLHANAAATPTLTAFLHVSGNGYVGINNTSPGRYLKVLGSSTASNANSIMMQGYQAALEVMNAAANVNYYFGVDDADGNKLKIGIGQSAEQGLVPTITITNGQPGNVGIGATNPVLPFEVHVGANQNLGIQSFNGTVGLNAFNDAGSAQVPCVVYASSLGLMGGNVGIGTATPAQNLVVTAANVTAQLSSTGSNSYARLIMNTPACDWRLLANGLGGNEFSIYDSTGGAARLMIAATSGNVSIGTNAANSKYPLYVSSAHGGLPTITYYGSEAMFGLDVPGNAELAFGWQAAAPYGWWLQSRNGGALPILLNAAGGAVGVGLNQPNVPLQVYGAAHDPSIGAGSYPAVLTVQGATMVQLDVGCEASSPFAVYLQARHSTTNNAPYGLLLQPSGGGVAVGTTSPYGTFRVRTGTDQNFVITGPQLVSGAVAINAINDAVSANIPLEIRSSETCFTVGSVGIGNVPTPPYLLDVNAGRTRLCASSEPYALRLDYVVGGSGYYLGVNSGANFVLSQNGGGTIVWIDQSGDTQLQGYLKVGSAASASQPGDVGISRNSAPGAGVIYFGNAGSAYIYFDTNGNYNIVGGVVTAISGSVSTGAGITAAGVIHSTSGGIQFPDNTVQTTAATGGGNDPRWINDSVGMHTNEPVAINNVAVSGWWFLVNGQAGGPSAWAIWSDARIKQNIRPLADDPVSLLGRLNWVRYEHNGLAGTTAGEEGIGLVAQEVATIIPEALTKPARMQLHPGDDETEMLALNYSVIYAHAARAIVQLTARIEQLEQKLGGAN